MYSKKIIKYGNSHCLIIPVEMMEGLGWQRADTVIFIIEARDRVLLRRVSDEKLIKLLEEQDNIIEA
jgi:antitoxin component of MazEF toxin-antitoxin module